MGWGKPYTLTLTGGVNFTWELLKRGLFSFFFNFSVSHQKLLRLDLCKCPSKDKKLNGLKTVNVDFVRLLYYKFNIPGTITLISAVD